MRPIPGIPDNYRPLARYVLSGGIATAIHYSILVILVEVAKLDETLSTAIGYFSSSIFHYLILYYWAFGSTATHSGAVIRFCGVAGSSLLLNSAIFWIFLEIIGLWYLVAQIITSCLVLGYTYSINSRFTFARR